jgi:hypothetical protein
MVRGIQPLSVMRDAWFGCCAPRTWLLGLFHLSGSILVATRYFQKGMPLPDIMALGGWRDMKSRAKMNGEAAGRQAHRRRGGRLGGGESDRGARPARKAGSGDLTVPPPLGQVP